MESEFPPEQILSPDRDTIQYRLKIALRDLEIYKDKVSQLERQLAFYKSQVDALTRDKAQLEHQLQERQTLLTAAKAERDEAIGEKFALLNEANERSTVSSSVARHSAASEAGQHMEEHLFKARAEICQLKANLEDCLFDRNEARRLLTVLFPQIRDEEIRQLNLYLEKTRTATPRATLLSSRPGAGGVQLSARGKGVNAK